MNKRSLVLLFVLFHLPPSAMGQSPFDGTWKMDMSSIQFDTKPDVYLLQNGVYDCKTCTPPIHIKADGTDQKVAGDPYSDTMSLKVIDDHNAESTSKKNGKIVGTAKYVVSSDGNHLTANWMYNGNPSGGTQTGSYAEKRVEKASADAHLISGSWRPEKVNVSDAALTWTYNVSGNELTMTNLTGQSYTTKLDGSDAPFKGDPGTTSVSAKMVGNTYEETLKRDGKVITVNKATISADGKTLSIVSEDKQQGTTTKGQAHKQ